MASIKLVLDQRRAKSDGKYPLMFRITHNRESFTVQLGVSFADKEWDHLLNQPQSNHPLCLHILNLIKEKELQYFREIIRIETKQEHYSLQELKEIILRPRHNVSFEDFTNQCIVALNREKRVGSALTYAQALSSLKKHSNGVLQFHQINFQFLTSYQTKMLEKGVSQNAIASYLRTIRAIFNKAINENICEEMLYPFRKFKIKTKETVSQTLNEKQIKDLLLRNFPENTAERQTQSILLLMYCLIGINFSDLCLLKKSNIIDNRIVYKRKKTSKIYSIKLLPKAKEILKELEDKNSEYLLPIMSGLKLDPIEEKKHINQQLKAFNQRINSIASTELFPGKISSYCIRYTWANTARKLGFSKELISEALGHSFGNRVTSIYLDPIGQKEIDVINKALIDELFNFKRG